jgi:hypothetical protein
VTEQEMGHCPSFSENKSYRRDRKKRKRKKGLFPDPDNISAEISFS